MCVCVLGFYVLQSLRTTGDGERNGLALLFVCLFFNALHLQHSFVVICGLVPNVATSLPSLSCRRSLAQARRPSSAQLLLLLFFSSSRLSSLRRWRYSTAAAANFYDYGHR
jgi:hypothetical protein